jgi:signal transduction histidine kinase
LLQISDNGKGFEKESTKIGNGLVNMRKRTEVIGGSFAVESSKTTGTTIRCHFPIANFSDARDI